MTNAIESHAQPLCRSYLMMLVRSLSVPIHERQGDRDSLLVWALGVGADGKFESLGVWPSQVNDDETRGTVLADLEIRGVERIRSIVGVVSDVPDRSPRRRVIQATQAVADKFQLLAQRALRRHGPFEITADAVACVSGALRRAELRLGDLTIQQAYRLTSTRTRSRTSKRRGTALRPAL